MTLRHEDILRAIAFYRYVTVTDITRLFFAYPASIKHAGKLLSRLAGGADYQEHHYLYRFPLPHVRVGNTEKIYTLGSRGRAYLQELGMEVDWYFRPSDASRLSYLHVQHALSLTRFLIAAQLYCRTHPAVAPPDVRTEYMLSKHPSRVILIERSGETHTEQKIKVVPDAWLNFALLRPDGTHDCFRPVLLEIDRSTEQQKYFKRHILSRIEFVKKDGAYQSLFGTDAVTVAYATTGTETRLASMCRWLEEVLEEQNKRTWAAIFRLCALSPDTLDPDRLFLHPTWYQPFATQPTPLFL